jgi:hypothetical protein
MIKTIRSEKRTFAKQYEESAVINANAEDVFAYVDDHARLSSHMSQSSWMMGGGSMETTIDEGKGQKVGSHIRMSGKAFGIPLFLDEVITKYEPPHRKVWETIGDVKLLVIGHYRMSIDIVPKNDSSLLRVSLDYDLPSNHVWLGRLAGDRYAKWCVRQMISSVRNNFDR